MSLKERMAIFEKNKGAAPVPATPYGIADANPIRTNMPELSKSLTSDLNPSKVPRRVLQRNQSRKRFRKKQLQTSKPLSISFSRERNDHLREAD